MYVHNSIAQNSEDIRTTWLPPEIVHHILYYCDPKSAHNFLRTCKDGRKLSQEPHYKVQDVFYHFQLECTNTSTSMVRIPALFGRIRAVMAVNTLVQQTVQKCLNDLKKMKTISCLYMYLGFDQKAIEQANLAEAPSKDDILVSFVQAKIDNGHLEDAALLLHQIQDDDKKNRTKRELAQAYAKLGQFEEVIYYVVDFGSFQIIDAYEDFGRLNEAGAYATVITDPEERKWIQRYIFEKYISSHRFSEALAFSTTFDIACDVVSSYIEQDEGEVELIEALITASPGEKQLQLAQLAVRRYIRIEAFDAANRIAEKIQDTAQFALAKLQILHSRARFYAKAGHFDEARQCLVENIKQSMLTTKGQRCAVIQDTAIVHIEIAMYAKEFESIEKIIQEAYLALNNSGAVHWRFAFSEVIEHLTKLQIEAGLFKEARRMIFEWQEVSRREASLQNLAQAIFSNLF